MNAPRPLRSLPRPSGLPILGSFLDLSRDPLGFFTRTVRTKGDLVHLRIGPVRSVLVSDPALIEHVLVKLRDDVRKDRVTRSLRRVLGQGLLTSEGQHWLRNRRVAAPSFQPAQIRRYAETFVETTVEHVGRLPRFGRRDVYQDMMAITLEIVVRTLFAVGTRPDTHRVGELVEILMEQSLVDTFTARALLPLGVPTPGRRRLDRAVQELNRMLETVIAEGRARPPGDDLLSRLMAARDEDGRGLTDVQLRDEIVTVFLAGHETTALTLSYALHLLSADGQAWSRLQEEVESITGGADPTLEHLPRLVYTDAVVKESMRLYPPAWIIGRDLLRDMELGGALIPAGTELTMVQWVVHRDPRWYRDPDVFRPERWLSGETEQNPKYAYFPFGGGPRVCVGNHFAKMEAALVLATLARHLDLKGIPGFSPRLVPAITLRPGDGIWMDVRRRQAG